MKARTFAFQLLGRQESRKLKFRRGDPAIKNTRDNGSIFIAQNNGINK